MFFLVYFNFNPRRCRIWVRFSNDDPLRSLVVVPSTRNLSKGYKFNSNSDVNDYLSSLLRHLSRLEDMLSTILLPVGIVKAVIVDQDSVGGGDDKDNGKAKAASELAATIETLRYFSIPQNRHCYVWYILPCPKLEREH